MDDRCFIEWPDNTTKYFKEVQDICNDVIEHRIKIISREGTKKEDFQKCGDLVVPETTLEKVYISARVRSYKYWLKYSNDFTIRSYNKGFPTEFHKIMKGYGDIYFYSFENKEKTGIHDWFVFSLPGFRLAVENGFDKYAERDNGDRTRFYTFDINSFDPPILLDQKDCFEIEGKYEIRKVQVKKLVLKREK